MQIKFGEIEVVVEGQCQIEIAETQDGSRISIKPIFDRESPTSMKPNREALTIPDEPNHPSSQLTEQEEKDLLRAAEAAQEGSVIWAGFIQTWKQGFGIEGVPQPDRAKLLTETMTLYSLHTFAFIRACGGLTSAVINVSTMPSNPADRKEWKKECRIIAENIAQVSSILCPPLCQFLEYPWKNRE